MCVGGERDGNWVVVLPCSVLLILCLGDLGLERLRPSARQRGARGSSVPQSFQLKDKFTGKPKDCEPPSETSQFLKEKSLQEILTGSVTGTVSLLALCTTEFME